MARVTVEDCIPVVPNRFELVLMAAERAREIGRGLPIGVQENSDRRPVIALREIAAQAIDLVHLRDACIRQFQRFPNDDPVEEIDEVMG